MMAEYYRPNAGIVVFNRQRKVLLCLRNDITNAWQFPQGGIEKGETPLQAALRELKEETSVTSVLPIKTLNKAARYRFTPEIIASMQQKGFNNVGQDMYWTLAFFEGEDSEINLQTEHPEFSSFRWGTIKEAYKLIADFKKSAYEIAVKEFAPIIAEYIYPIDKQS